MALEIERRFLVCSDAWRALAGAPQALRQGYLASSEQGVTVRLRIKDEQQAWLTLKAPAGGYARHEFEYPLPLADAEDLWLLAPQRLDQNPLRPEPPRWGLGCGLLCGRERSPCARRGGTSVC